MQTFYWFDFETFGINPAKDKPSQFAGIRTDHNFNIIGEPLNIFCKPSNDFLPHPEACLVTGITPQQAMEQGVCERDFFNTIQAEISTANTCSVGYNSIRFDDEVIRFGLYRNFYDAYSREWQNGNSRWDILDMLRMTHALRPEGIKWPINEEGKASFRLELLTKANGVEHENAHDALADVYATIAMAKLVKQKQPRLFNFLFDLRKKNRASLEINLETRKPFVHCSGMLGSNNQFTGVMMPLMAHPVNKNSIICLNLVPSIDDLHNLTPEELSLRLFTRQEDLPEGIERVAIKEVHLNKCPAIAPLGVLNETVQKRLNINLSECIDKAQIVSGFLNSFCHTLHEVYTQNKFAPISNPDYALYSGGFFSASDKKQMEHIRKLSWHDLSQSTFYFNDGRLDEMLLRYRARNAPESLSVQEIQAWNEYRAFMLLSEDSDATLNYPQLLTKLEDLQNQPDNSPIQKQILSQIKDYSSALIGELKNFSKQG